MGRAFYWSECGPQAEAPEHGQQHQRADAAGLLQAGFHLGLIGLWQRARVGLQRWKIVWVVAFLGHNVFSDSV
jgi:hypothetical protein